ncbi:MAG: amidinotransferase [Planctomycetaceae bacterium]|nr:amidinotransferase [Planctomycetaceae bacterium]
MAEILMCPPDYFGIEYEINPWMNCQRNADRDLAVSQWEQLRCTLIAAGATIQEMTPVAGLPDLVFTANAALVFHKKALISRFRPVERQPEQLHDASWFQENGFEVQQMVEPFCFEGAGDALFCGDTLWAGYRMRSDALAQQAIGKVLDVQVIPLELVDPYYYHLDTCFCPLSPNTAMYYPAAFDDYGRRVLCQSIDHLIEIEEQEARHFAANAVVVGNTVVTNVGCPRLHRSLQQGGFVPIDTPLGEFVKAGGSAKCLTLRLDGEEAASWK